MLAAAAGGTRGGRTIVLSLLPATTPLGGKKEMASCMPLELFQIRTEIRRWAWQHLLKEKAHKTEGMLFSRL